MAYGGNYDPHKGRGYKWGGVTNGGDKKSTTDTSNSNPGGGTTSSRDIRREVGKKAVDNDFGWGDIGDLARDFLDGVGYAVGDGLRSLGFGDPNPAQQAANMDRQRGVTGARSGGPGQDRERIKQNPQTPQTPFAPAASAPASSPAALRTAADLQNYLSDLQRIAIGNADAQEALARFGIAPEQSMFSYRESFPEFGDSMSNLSLPEIIKRFNNMSPNPEPFAEGGRVGNNTDARGDERVRPRPDSGVSTDLAKFGDMLRDLMMITPETDGRGIENPFGAPDKPQARRPQALRPQDPRPQEPSQITPGGLMPQQSQSRPPVSRMEKQAESPQDGFNAGAFMYADRARPEIEVERLAPPPPPSTLTPMVDFVEPYQYTMRDYETDSEFLLSKRELTAYEILTGEGLSGRAAMDRVKSMTPDQLDMMVEVANSSEGFKNGGSVRGRRDALPLVEGDHVVPAHAVKGNESGLAALSKKLMDNQNYNGMISGPGGPRDDAIKTRVYAAGGGISGKMDNLQNPFNSVPARVSNKEYVIPRDAITNLGMMNGAQEGDANKVGQDMIYQLVEHLKRKT
jgi:hypothetical protein